MMNYVTFTSDSAITTDKVWTATNIAPTAYANPFKAGDLCYVRNEERDGPFAVLDVSDEGVGENDDNGEWVWDTEEPCLLVGGIVENLPEWVMIGKPEQGKVWIYAKWCMTADKRNELAKQEQQEAVESQKRLENARKTREEAKVAADKAKKIAEDQARVEWWDTYGGDIVKIALGVGSAVSGFAALWLL